MGIDAGEGIALYAECLRGLVFSPNGLLKLVFQKSTGRIVGVHVCGEDACELIHYGMEIVKTRRTVTEVASAIYSAVTFHEMYRIAAFALAACTLPTFGLWFVVYSFRADRPISTIPSHQVV